MNKPFAFGAHKILKEDLTTAETIVIAMQKEGHAIQLEKTFSHDFKFLSAQVHHYTTCLRCVEIKQEEVKQNGKVEQSKGKTSGI